LHRSLEVIVDILDTFKYLFSSLIGVSNSLTEKQPLNTRKIEAELEAKTTE